MLNVCFAERLLSRTGLTRSILDYARLLYDLGNLLNPERTVRLLSYLDSACKCHVTFEPPQNSHRSRPWLKEVEQPEEYSKKAYSEYDFNLHTIVTFSGNYPST